VVRRGVLEGDVESGHAERRPPHVRHHPRVRPLREVLLRRDLGSIL
jgi:hypothetical protein